MKGELERIIEENYRAERPVIIDLSDAGFQAEHIADLYNLRYDYRSAIPILLEWLPKVENQDVKESIVRALSVKWAKGTDAQFLLLDELRKQAADTSLNWAIGNALEVIADQRAADDILVLVQNEAYGSARQMLILALGKMKYIKAEDSLIALLKNQDLIGHAIIALGKIGSKKAYPLIEQYLNHDKSWVRNEAKKALERIGRR